MSHDTPHYPGVSKKSVNDLLEAHRRHTLLEMAAHQHVLVVGQPLLSLAQILSATASSVTVGVADPNVANSWSKTHQVPALQIQGMGAPPWPWRTHQFDLVILQSDATEPHSPQTDLTEALRVRHPKGRMILIAETNPASWAEVLRTTQALSSTPSISWQHVMPLSLISSPKPMSASMTSSDGPAGLWAIMEWKNGDPTSLAGHHAMDSLAKVCAPFMYATDQAMVHGLKRDNEKMAEANATLAENWQEAARQVEDFRQQTTQLQADLSQFQTEAAQRQSEAAHTIDTLRFERDQLKKRLEIIEASRSWQLTQSYWNFMDHHPVGRTLRKIRHRRGPNP